MDALLLLPVDNNAFCLDDLLKDEAQTHLVDMLNVRSMKLIWMEKTAETKHQFRIEPNKPFNPHFLWGTDTLVLFSWTTLSGFSFCHVSRVYWMTGTDWWRRPAAGWRRPARCWGCWRCRRRWCRWSWEERRYWWRRKEAFVAPRSPWGSLDRPGSRRRRRWAEGSRQSRRPAWKSFPPDPGSEEPPRSWRAGRRWSWRERRTKSRAGGDSRRNCEGVFSLFWWRKWTKVQEERSHRPLWLLVSSYMLLLF